jgi:UDP-glucose 4-epimerase
MNVLITGGAGYIGAELVKKLAGQSDVGQITVYDNLARKNYNFFTSYKLESNKVKFIEGDLLDSRKLRSALKDIDIVYHLAALTDKNPSLDSHMFEQVNHWGSSELINAIEESKVSKVIYASSLAVYGEGPEIFTEEAETNPKSFYATSKWRGEEQLKRLFEKKKSYIFRIGNVYGFSPCMRFDGVINKFMLDAHFKGRVQIHGNGRQLRSYIHIDKVVNALAQATSFSQASDVYNLSDKNIQVLDIIEAMQEIYPQLEFIFINQHLKIEDLQVETNGKWNTLFKSSSSNLVDELKEFKSRFSF